MKKTTTSAMLFCIQVLIYQKSNFLYRIAKIVSNSKVPTFTKILRYEVGMINIKTERSSFT